MAMSSENGRGPSTHPRYQRGGRTGPQYYMGGRMHKRAASGTAGVTPAPATPDKHRPRPGPRGASARAVREARPGATLA